MKEQRRALGRGLDALIPATRQARILEVAADHIDSNPRQPRSQFNDESLAELSASIAEYGILQPLLVSESELPGPDGLPRYQLIAGERRLLAARRAGLAEVPVVVRGANAEELLELALVENIQRQDLSPLEVAYAYQQLAKEFELTQEQIAEKVGKSRSAVTNSIRLLSLSPTVRSALADGRITEGHARALLGLRESEDQAKALSIIIDRGLNVRQTEKLVQDWQEQEGPPRSKRRPDPETRAIEDSFRQALGTKVELVRGRKGGKLIIHFYSEDELRGIYDTIAAGE